MDIGCAAVCQLGRGLSRCSKVDTETSGELLGDAGGSGAGVEDQDRFLRFVAVFEENRHVDIAIDDRHLGRLPGGGNILANDGPAAVVTGDLFRAVDEAAADAQGTEGRHVVEVEIQTSRAMRSAATARQRIGSFSILKWPQ